jgi:uncharacterized OsmC-like protein/pimeloyl-ACP methyl ester carboxylesterase
VGKITSERIEFTGHDGNSRLAARLDSPPGGGHAVALFAHCFTCSKDIHAASRISEALADRGFAVLRFDFTGLGASEGEFANTDYSSNIQDLIAAAGHLKSIGHSPEVLVGHSLGGAAVLAAARHIDSVKAVATIGAPADPGHVAHMFADKAYKIRADGKAEVEIAERSFTISRQFLDDISEHNLAENLGSLKRALLIFHAPRDNIVGIDNAGTIFAAARHPKSFISLDDADHLLSHKADAVYVADVLAAWASRYIDEDIRNDLPVTPEGYSVLVAEQGNGAYTQDVMADDCHLIADEPEKAGGDGRGPRPHAYLLSGLGACTSMTLRMYARHKRWEIGPISVALRLRAINRDDPDAGRRIEREITVAGPLSAEQREKLVEIANKCPVHRTLTGPLEISTRLAE